MLGSGAWFSATVPVIALLGAASTASHASYLIFNWQYAARLEV